MALDPLELVGGLAIGTGLGGAISDTVNPRLQSFKNDQWSAHTDVYPAATTLAAGVAQGQIDPKLAEQWATFTGFGTQAFNALVQIANTGPPLASALTLLRRGVWTHGQYQGALNRAAIEPGWWPGLETLQDVWLTPDQLAVMVQRSVVANDGLLPNQPDSSGSNVPPMPQIGIDPVTEAAGGGINKERLSGLARIIGLPASPDLAARMTYRGIINKDAFYQALKEGNTRAEWGPFLFEGFREIPTAEQFVELHLRGWITQKEMYDGCALHGMSNGDADLEFKLHRRAITPHQIKQGLARGAQFNPQAGEIQNPYSAAAHQSSLGPEWYDLYESLAPSYPSLFITNRLVTAGTISADTGHTWLLKAGNADEVATAMLDSWQGGGTTKADPHVAKAQTQLWTTTHALHKKGTITDAQATAALPYAGVSAAAIPEVLRIWDVENTLENGGTPPPA